MLLPITITMFTITFAFVPILALPLVLNAVFLSNASSDLHFCPENKANFVVTAFTIVVSRKEHAFKHKNTGNVLTFKQRAVLNVVL